MKVDNSQQISPIHQTPKTDRPIATEQASSPSPQDKTPSTDPAKLRISQWFARAGILPRQLVSSGQEAVKRVHRHQTLKAQRKVENLERVQELALSFSVEQIQQQQLDPDWFFSFIDMAEDIHSPAMQELWGKILAVEISRPGSFSLKTLLTLKQLTQKDAGIFQSAVKLASRKKGEHVPKLVFGYHQKPSLLSWLKMPQQMQLNLAEYGLAYPDLLALMDMGLIFSSEIESAELSTASRTQWRCCNEVFHLAPKRSGIALQYYKFTNTGAELAKLVSQKPRQGYVEGLKSLLSEGFEIT